MRNIKVKLIAFLTIVACAKDFGLTETEAIEQNLLDEAGKDLSGYKIAFSDLFNIYMMNPDGKGLEQLTNTGKLSSYVSWSPDGKYIYFAGVHDISSLAAWEAYRVNVKTKELTQISSFDKDVRSLGVSPDGETLAISVMTGNSNIGNNNNELTKFSSNLYTMPISEVESKLSSGNQIVMEDLTPLLSSPNDEQFWYEELNWNHDSDNPLLAYTKTWRYDEDEVSYTHAYTIKADGSDNTLIAENADQPIWSIDSDKISFLDLSYYDVELKIIKVSNVIGINEEVSGGSFSPLGGKYIVYEIGDENRKGGIAKTEQLNTGSQFPFIGIYEPRWSPVLIDTDKNKN